MQIYLMTGQECYLHAKKNRMNHYDNVTNMTKLNMIQRDGVVESLTMYFSLGSEVARLNPGKLK